jgi:hypothetical protein
MRRFKVGKLYENSLYQPKFFKPTDRNMLLSLTNHGTLPFDKEKGDHSLAW